MTGVASAAPAGFTVNVNHSTGALATSVSGKLAWSTSHRTVTLSDWGVFIRANECALVTMRGYQGSTPVTAPYQFGDCAESTDLPPIWKPPESITTTTPGGVQHVIIRLYDHWHEISHYANCYVTATTCQYG